MTSNQHAHLARALTTRLVASERTEVESTVHAYTKENGNVNVAFGTASSNQAASARPPKPNPMHASIHQKE